MKESEEKTAIVTGGSSGIGRCTAMALRDAGCRVYEFSRRDNPIPGVRHMGVDVTNEEQIRAAVAEILKEAGGIDILINCAGFGISGAVEFTPAEQARQQFDVNFFGAVNVSRAVIPAMRERGSGRIVNVSSVAAVAHIPFQAFYSASKAALSSYSCALDNELRPYGIRVTAVQLGDIRTGFTQARQKVAEGDEAYGGRISRSVSRMERDEETGMSPEFAARFLTRVALKPRSAPIRTAGRWYQFLNLLCKLLPSGLRNGIVYAIYAK